MLRDRSSLIGQLRSHLAINKTCCRNHSHTNSATMSGAKELQALQAHSEEKMRKHSSWKRRFTFFANHAFVLLTTVGVIVGFAIGFGVRKLDPSPMTIQWLGEWNMEAKGFGPMLFGLNSILFDDIDGKCFCLLISVDE